MTSLHGRTSLFVLARSSPSAQTGIPVGCYSEAGVVRCAPSVHSSMSKYHEVSSLVLVVTPTVMYITCEAARHASVLELYSTTKAPQHQYPSSEACLVNPLLESWPRTWGQCKMLLWQHCNSESQGMLPTRRRLAPECGWCCPVGL